MSFIKLPYILVITFLLLTSSKIEAQSINQNIPEIFNNPKPANLILNKFQMNHGLTFTTSMSNGLSETTGIYSNLSKYKLSEKIHLNSTIHIIQNQNNRFTSSSNFLILGTPISKFVLYLPDGTLSYFKSLS